MDDTELTLNLSAEIAFDAKFIYLSLALLAFLIGLFNCIKVVTKHETMLIYRWGRVMTKGPGIIFILPFIDSYVRTRTYEIPPQEESTKDCVKVLVKAMVFYRVSNATASIVKNAHDFIGSLAQTILRNSIGIRHLHEILSERVSLSRSIHLQLDNATDGWGIKVERVEIKVVCLPVSLQRPMDAEAEAAREARPIVIEIIDEQNKAKALRETNETTGNLPAALHISTLTM